jgi:hypothetical protein
VKSRSIRKLATIVVLAAVGAIVISGAWCVYCGISNSLEAEKTLHAFRMVVNLVSTHVKNTSGQWPRSWDDLRRLSTSGAAGWQWPRDIEKTQERIEIDFSATCAEVGKEDPENFRAIRQLGPNYGSWPSASLVNICRKYQGNHTENRTKDDSADGATIGRESNRKPGRADAEANKAK